MRNIIAIFPVPIFTEHMIRLMLLTLGGAAIVHKGSPMQPFLHTRAEVDATRRKKLAEEAANRITVPEQTANTDPWLKKRVQSLHRDERIERQKKLERREGYEPIFREMNVGSTSIRDNSSHMRVTDMAVKNERFVPDLSAAFAPELPGIPGGVWDFSGEETTQATPQEPDPVVVPMG